MREDVQVGEAVVHASAGNGCQRLTAHRAAANARCYEAKLLAPMGCRPRQQGATHSCCVTTTPGGEFFAKACQWRTPDRIAMLLAGMRQGQCRANNSWVELPGAVLPHKCSLFSSACT